MIKKHSLYQLLHWVVTLALLGNIAWPAFAFSRPQPAYRDLNALNQPLVANKTPGSFNTAASTISITDSAFVPAVITVTTGMKVTWSNDGNVAHQIKSGTLPRLPVISSTCPLSCKTHRQALL